VLVLLAALTFPAVFFARESVRKAQCASQLGQLSQYFHSYESITKELPDFDFCFHYLRTIDAASAESLLSEDYPNKDVGFKMPRVLQCPSDFVPSPKGPWAFRSEEISISYRLNAGSDFRMRNGVLPVFDLNKKMQPRKLSEVSDGLSNTAFAAENLYLNLDEKRQDRRSTDGLYFEFQAGDEDRILAEARKARAQGPVLVSPPSVYSVRLDYGYNHVGPPNEWRFRLTGYNPGGFAYYYGMYPPSSLHPGGVNLTMADGATRFISDQIDLAVFRAIGSIDGHETVDVEQ
jgi:prepilin-type processing-associated H-X9-DG protein